MREPRCQGDDHWWNVKKGETAPRYGDWCECGQSQFFPSHARDPSVRDVLAQLDRIEAKLDELLLKANWKQRATRVASDGSWVETK